MIDKLIQVQAELRAPKSQYNSFGGFSYRSCEDIVEAVKPLLAKQGLLLTIKDEVELIGDRFYIRATATVTDGNTLIASTAYAREERTKKGMDAAQITGSASSYRRKYALNGLFCIDDNKDPDTVQNAEPAAKPSAAPQMTQCAICGKKIPSAQAQAVYKDGKAYPACPDCFNKVQGAGK